MANNPQMLIRVAANIDELRKNLSEGRATIEYTTAAMQKMAASFSGDKLVQHAHNVTAAINEVGVSALTAAEAGRQLSVLERAMEKLELTGRPIPPGMRATADALGQIVDRGKPAVGIFGDLTNQVKATALGMVSAQAIIGTVQTSFRTLTQFLGSSVDSFAASEAAQKKMTTALQSAGRAGADTIDQFNALASKMEQTTVYSDDLTTQMQALLIEIGDVLPGDMERAQMAAADLASGLGIDLESATRLVGKAFAGETGTLKKFGIVIDDAKLKAEGMPAVLDAIQARFGGQAQAEVETYSGRVKQLANAWDNFKESVGQAIVENPFVVAGLRNMTKGVQDFNAEPVKSKSTWTDWFGFIGWGLDRITTRQAAINEQFATFRKMQSDAFANAPKMATIPTGPAQLQNPLDVNKYLDDIIEKQKEAAAAAKAHAQAIKALSEAYSGATAIKAAADAMEAVNRNLKAGIAVSQMTREQQNALNKTLGTAITAYAQLGQVAPQAIRDVYVATVDWVDITEKTNAAFAKLPRHVETITTLDGATLGLNGRFKELDAALDKITKGPKLTPLAQSADDAVKAVALLQHSLGDDLTKTLLSLPDILTRAFEGGGGIGGAMKSIAIRFGQDFGKEMSAAIAAQLKAGGSSMSGSSIGAAGGMGILAVGTTAASGGSTGQQLGAAVSSGMSAASMASMAGATTAASVAFAAYTAGAGLAVIAAIKIYKAMNDGRKAMQDFYKTFQGGADELRTRMLILGDAGEAMWVKLTQRTGKGDKAGAQQITAEIMKALTEAESIQAAISAAGFKSQDELKATADAAMKVWQTMKDSGKYSAEQVAAAWEMAQEAIRVSLGQTATAQTEANTKALAAIKAMDDEMKSLSDSIAGEAPEEFMGVVERQTRDRIAAIAAQRDAAQKELDQTTTDAAAAAKEAGDVIDAALAAREYHVRVKVDLEGLPGGDVPIYTTRSGGSSGGGVSVSLQPQPIYLDGREIARNQAQHLPSVLSGMGL